jgi:hypothetical protein
MQTKLTLRVDDQTVRRAKSYARVRRTSLSRIVEEYFRRLEGGESATPVDTPVLGELAGLLAGQGNPSALKKSYRAHLEEKYR